MGQPSPTRSRLEVGLLGPFRVTSDGEPVQISSGRLRSIVAALALTPGRAVSIAFLVDALWDSTLPMDARGTLHTYITRLRHLLGSTSITTEPNGYALRTDPDDVDVLRFGRLVDRAGEDGDAERALLVEALRLWRGKPLDDVPSRALRETEAVHWSERRLDVLERRIALDLRAGSVSDVVPELRELAEAHPLRETLWLLLLTALARLGRQAEALERYELIRSRIAEELGVDPSAALQQTYRDLLAGDVRSPDESVEGQDRLPIPRQLPADVANFSGRAAAVSTLDELLSAHEPDRAARVAIHGAGGTGKTSLAGHWAHRVASQFPDGQLYVNLHGYGPGEPIEPAAVLVNVLRALGISGEQIPPDVDARSSLFRSLLSDRRILLVLDNARSSEHVRPLLPGVGASFTMITSRSQLRSLVARDGVRRIGIDQLDPDESIALLSSTLDAAGVAYDKPVLVELAELCDHLPLALSIAVERAGRDPESGLTDLVQELRDERGRLDVLDAGDDPAGSLRTVFAWSYRALDGDIAAVFRLLGLFPGPDLAAGAAAALAGMPMAAIRRSLDRLVDANLLMRRRAGRYELHDLIRGYAAELVERHDDAAVRDAAFDRLLNWYLHTSAQGRVTMVGRPELLQLDDVRAGVEPRAFESIDQAAAWYDAERSNLIALTRRAIDGGYEQPGCRILMSMAHDLTRQRAFEILAELLPAGVTAARRVGDVLAEAELSQQNGILDGNKDHYHDSLHHFLAALGLYERAGSTIGQRRVLSNLGVLESNRLELTEAVTYFERALAFEDDIGVNANLLYNLADCYVDLERYDEAAELSLRALDLSRRHDSDPNDEPAALGTLALARAGQGHYDEAVELNMRAVEQYRETHDEWYVCITLGNAGRAYFVMGRLDKAAEVWQQTLEMFDDMGSGDGMNLSRNELVELLDLVEYLQRDAEG